LRAKDCAIRPSCFNSAGVPDDDECDEWTDTIRYSNEACQDTTQFQRRNFANVAHHHSRHDTNRKAIDELAGKEDGVSSRNELDGNRDECDDQ
jgi:hypothetical protein